MKRITAGCFAVLLTISSAILVNYPALAQTGLTPELALARVWQQSPVHPEWFDVAFLTQIPAAQVDQIVAQYKQQLGSFQHAEATPDGFIVAMDRGTFPAKIALNADGQITGIWFGAPEPFQSAKVEDIFKDLASLPGKVSVAVVEDGNARASLHPEKALAVGSAFKLAVLATLSRQIFAGKHCWNEVVELNPAWKSLPSSVLLKWPDQTPLTLATLANQMISISDNTAADGLLLIAGREQVEKLAPRNQPFLSTREAFALKAKANAELLARYRAADSTGRRALLPEIDKASLPNVMEFEDAPIAPDIEWFFTTPELCALLREVADLPAMRINPGVAKPSDWKQIAFKGGSEPGVLNLTTAVVAKNGRRYCVSATWNDTAKLDETRFSTMYISLLNSLAKESAK